MDVVKRKNNERLFPNWKELDEGGRQYWYEIKGKSDWCARYVKEVNAQEETIRFYQEIVNEQGIIVERHEKYPEDSGHQPIKH